MRANTKTITILAAATGIAALAIALSASSAAHKPALAVAADTGSAQADSPGEPGEPGESGEPGGDTIQIALLLDTSSSMSGLINQARTQLWRIVNEMAEARRDGRRPELRLALFEYGKPSLGAETGYVREVVPFTDDLDRVSEELFALTTSGGDEYAGHVIRTATNTLAWSDRPGDLKLIFIAGNESFEQGAVDVREAIPAARERGIIVNTIYCGTAGDGAHRGWHAGAELAGGRSLNIDHNQAIVHIDAPQDAEIATLGAKLNETYIGYGSLGAGNEARQIAQDGNAAMAGSMVQRSLSKASAVYNNGHWDLVDGLDRGVVAWDRLTDDELPEDMRGMSAAERKAHVDGKRAERERIKRRIGELNTAREAFVTAKRRELAGGDTLDAALLEVVRELARDKGFTLD